MIRFACVGLAFTFALSNVPSNGANVQLASARSCDETASG